MHAPAPASSAVEDYLKAVYALETRLQGPVPTNALAERLGVTPGSVSGMLRRLDELGLLEHERSRGVQDAGATSIYHVLHAFGTGFKE